MDFKQKKTNELVVNSKKSDTPVVFTLNDEHLAKENYECVGMSNADYGS